MRKEFTIIYFTQLKLLNAFKYKVTAECLACGKHRPYQHPECLIPVGSHSKERRKVQLPFLFREGETEAPAGLSNLPKFALVRVRARGFPGGSVGKESTYDAGEPGSIPGSGKIPWRKEWQPTPVFLTGKLHGQRSLAGYSPMGHKRVGYNLVTEQQQQGIYGIGSWASL